MAIVKVERFHLLVPETAKESLLRALQFFRNVEFTDQALDKDELRFTKTYDMDKVHGLDDYLDKCEYTIRLMTKYSPKTGGFKALKEGLPNLTFKELEEQVNEKQLKAVYAETKVLGDRLDNLNYKLSKTKEEMEQLAPFKNLGIREKDLKKLKRTRWLVGSVPIKAAKEFEAGLEEEDYLHIEDIGIREDDKYYLLFFIGDIHKLEEKLRSLNFSRVKVNLAQVPDKTLKRLDMKKTRIRQEMANVKEQVSSQATSLQFVEICYEYFRNVRMRYEEEERFLKTKKVNAIEGYIASEQKEEFLNVIDEATHGIYDVRFEEIERTDGGDIPIMLKNNRLVKAFESVTTTYSLPRYDEVDPTPFFTGLYALFFGMMAADFAYGVILFVVSLGARKLFNLTPSMNLMMRFFQTISIPVMIWGFLYGSYFGAEIPGVWHLFTPNEDFMAIMIISLTIGVIQIFYSLGIKAYILVRNGQPMEVLYECISWGMALAGVILFLGGSVAGLPAVAVQIGKWVMIVGFVIIILAGARAASGNPVARLVAGIYNLYGISSYLGDIVSYSRLMALGLSGGFIAFAINTIASMMFGSPIGIPFAIIVLVFFHAFNLFLSFLGAYVHSLRLVYVEFFGKFYEGGGRAFRFFRKKPKYINLDRQFEE